MGQRGPIGLQAKLTAVQPAGGPEVHIEPPEGIGSEAQAEFSRIVALLRSRSVLDAADATALRDMAVCIDRLHRCEADIAARGIVLSNGTKNPAVACARQYRDSLVAWAKEFGLSPASRGRAGLPGGDKTGRRNRFAELGEGAAA